MQSSIATARRFAAHASVWIKPLFVLALGAATLLLVQRASPAVWSMADLGRLATHFLGDPARHDEPVLLLQSTHLLRVVTAILAGLVLGVSAAAWQTLRRSPGACVQMTGLPLAASLGAVSGHIATHNMSWPAMAAPVAHGLPLLTGTLGALLMAAALAWAAHRRGRHLAVLQRNPASRHLAHAAWPLSPIVGVLSVWLLHRVMPSQPTAFGFWLVGSFAHGHLAPWLPALACIALGVAILSYVSGAMAQLLPGDAWARQAGIKVTSTKVLACVGICLLLAAAANLAGNILGIGLVAVTLARLCVGDMPRLLWPTAGFLGAVAALWVDALAQASGDVQELPVGLIGAVLAAAGLWANNTTAAQART